MGIEDIIEEKAARSPGVTPPSVREAQREARIQRQRENADVLADGGGSSSGSTTMPEMSLTVNGRQLSVASFARFIEDNPEVAQAYLLAANTLLLFLILWKV
jgi:hypothetical protein